jgi:hypothetical protein
MFAGQGTDDHRISHPEKSPAIVANLDTTRDSL